MNKKIYSLVWNKSLRQIVVASELASVKGGGGSSGESGGVGRGLRGAVLCAALALCRGTDLSGRIALSQDLLAELGER